MRMRVFGFFLTEEGKHKIDFQIKRNSNQLNLKSVEAQIKRISNQLNLKSIESQIR